MGYIKVASKYYNIKYNINSGQNYSIIVQFHFDHYLLVTTLIET